LRSLNLVLCTPRVERHIWLKSYHGGSLTKRYRALSVIFIQLIFIPVRKITEKAVCRSEFLTKWHCNLITQLAKKNALL